MRGARGGRNYPPRSGVTAGMTHPGQAGYTTGGGYAPTTTTMAAGFTTTYVSGAPYSGGDASYSSSNTTTASNTYGATTRSTGAYSSTATRGSNGAYGGYSSTPAPAGILKKEVKVEASPSWEQHLKQIDQKPPVVQSEDTAMEVDKEAPSKGKKRKTFQFTKRTKRPKLEPKNPVLLLNELKPGLSYVFGDSDGTPATHTYKCSIVVNGITYEGQGGSKKEARHKAAENALKQQIIAKNNDIYEKLAKRVTSTPADGELPDNVDNEQLFKLIDTDPTPPLPTTQPKEKHPVMLLNEYAEKVLTYECIKDEGTVGKQKYTMKVVVNEESFEGSARNLKAAKAQAARLALAKLFNVFVPDSDVGSTGMSIVKDSVTLLGELHRTPLYYEMVENTGGGGTAGPGGPRVIVMKVTVNGLPFEGKGKTKKQAKARAAQNALAEMYGVTGEVPMSQIGGVSLFRSPITVLQHYNGPQTAYELTENSEGLNKSITASVIVSGETYTGTAGNKKAAKTAAARSALSKAFKINIPDDETPPPMSTPPKALAKRGGFTGMMRGGFVGIPGYAPCYPGFYGGYGFSNYTSFSNYNASVSPQQLNQMIPAKARLPSNPVKPPTQLLMETHKSSLTYECVKEEGPIHSKMYTMVVHVNGVPYEGVAKSKKEAKYNAARNALQQVYKIKEEEIAKTPTTAANGGVPEPSRGVVVPSPCIIPAKAQHAEMHPVMLLNQLSNEKHNYTCISEEGPVHDRLYTMQVTTKEKVFTGQARNKKDAKAAAARNALAALYNVQQSA